ncbi:hypothetical protein ANN_27312 [Periplaneta americana]|uniref:Uncharacterized protein n=1 Tax=Periplaneta americana TaxID=6978 RepID=A0ABQ8RXV1_PERAM|nr:hypothetical protein ANN_27312 [Periplaneta americana]
MLRPPSTPGKRSGFNTYSSNPIDLLPIGQNQFYPESILEHTSIKHKFYRDTVKILAKYRTSTYDSIRQIILASYKILAVAIGLLRIHAVSFIQRRSCEFAVQSSMASFGMIINTIECVTAFIAYCCYYSFYTQSVRLHNVRGDRHEGHMQHKYIFRNSSHSCHYRRYRTYRFLDSRLDDKSFSTEC